MGDRLFCRIGIQERKLIGFEPTQLHVKYDNLQSSKVPYISLRLTATANP